MQRQGLLPTRSALWVAAVLSLLLHGVALGVLAPWWLKRWEPQSFRENGVLASIWQALASSSPPEALAWANAPDVAMVAESEALPERWQARRAGDDETRKLESAPRVADGLDPRPPAPDSGKEAGLAHPDSWRRDRQTLRAQLTDGSQVNHTARTKVALSLSSPQAERRERLVAVGDAPQTAKEALALTMASLPSASPSDETVKLGRQEALRERAGALAQSGEGPLEARQGERRFDTDTLGAARDVQDQRSAASDSRPGPIDLAAAGSPGPKDAQSQRGPAKTPGAVDHFSKGVAPSLYGAPVAAPVGAKVALSAQEVRRERFLREIRQRALAALKFPRKLALELQQGETIVRFLVGADGGVSGAISVTKSAGFREFDEEAAAAVRRAAPFPKMPEALNVQMRVLFENPVLR